jgi:hypothetical protein
MTYSTLSRFRVIVSCLLAAGAFPGAASAESVALALPLTTRQMAAQADLIAIGQCVGTRSQWLGRELVTLATISLSEVMKGQEGSTVTVVLPGGIDATRRIKVASTWVGAPTIRPREEVFLFLRRGEAVPGAYAVLGFSQGKLSIVPDRQGKQVSQDLTRLRMVAGDRVIRGAHTTATLSEFKHEVRGYLQQPRPQP